MSATRFGPPTDWPPAAGPRHSASEDHRTRSQRTRRRRKDASPWNWLLLIPIALPLLPFLYNRVEPTLWGLPFFYWCQLGFAFLASLILAIVHIKVR
ncbi:DUF3311 domain-containing protein [Actinoplanes sp. NPDC049265]|uniref:DUF3311 domain-containing protein n=1 Tax=Actinoplanes sp. NPDC049265 TaxID=3363902 RepID=UPI00372356C3